MNTGCGKYKDLLLDLAYDELDDAAAEAIRSHASECTQCAAAISELLSVRRLSARPFVLTPSAAVDDAVLAAARDSLSESADTTGVRNVAPSPRDDAPGFWETLRAWLLHPAFAGAAVIALVLTMTLFFSLRAPKSESPTDVESLLAEQASRAEEPPTAAAVPPEAKNEKRDRDREEEIAAPAPPHPVVSAPPLSEIAPAPTASEDAPAGTFAAADSKAVARSKQAPKKEAKGRAAPNAEFIKDLRRSATPSPGRSASSSSAVGAGEGAARAEEPTADRAPLEMDEVLRAPTVEPPSPEKRKSGIDYAPPPPARAPASRSDQVAADSTTADDEETAAPEALAPEAAVSEKSARTTAPTVQPKSDAYTEGMAAYRRGNCTEAAARFSEVVASPALFPGKVPVALHHLGRCEARRGRCAPALRWYDELIGRHPAYAARPEALYEAARCAERLGRKDKAKELLRALRQYRGWESRAAEMEAGL